MGGGDRTRMVRLHGGQLREDADNTKTGIVILDDLRPGRSFEMLFHDNWSAIRDVLVSFRQHGVAVVAFDAERGRPAGSLCLAAYPTRANSAVIGRHSMTDLYLHADPALSLRHMVLIVDPLSRCIGGDVRFRLVDLRTRNAFEDETGRSMEAVAAEGPMFLRIGRYALFCIPTSDRPIWPEDSDEAWACIPERVYLEETAAEPDRWSRQRRRRGAVQVSRMAAPMDPDADRKITHVQRLRGPARARHNLLSDGEQPIGCLVLEAEGATRQLVLGERAAHQGILFGRYDRCDAADENLLVDRNISRVHLLIVGVGNELYAIDTASTNGTWLRAGTGVGVAREATGAPHPNAMIGTVVEEEWQEIRIVALTDRTELCFGDGLAYMRWEPTGRPGR